jgi:hypothetical protein
LLGCALGLRLLLHACMRCACVRVLGKLMRPAQGLLYLCLSTTSASKPSCCCVTPPPPAGHASPALSQGHLQRVRQQGCTMRPLPRQGHHHCWCCLELCGSLQPRQPRLQARAHTWRSHPLQRALPQGHLWSRRPELPALC